MLLALWLALLTVCVTTVRSSYVSVYNLMTIAYANESQQYSVANESQCSSACAGNTAAVAYSEVLKLCYNTRNPNIRMTESGFWKVFVCVNVELSCSLPNPFMEWYATDFLGFANTGYINTGLMIRPTYFGAAGNEASPWNSSYTASINPTFGSSILFPNIYNYLLMTDKFELTFDATKSLTLFAYVWLSAASTEFPLFIFGYTDASGKYSGFISEFWILGGGLYINLFGMCPTGCLVTYSYTVRVNEWTHLAAVYDAKTKTITGYVNGTTNNWQSVTINSAGQYTANLILIGGRPTFGTLAGSIFCLRMFEKALSASEIQATASTCSTYSLQVV